MSCGSAADSRNIIAPSGEKREPQPLLIETDWSVAVLQCIATIMKGKISLGVNNVNKLLLLNQLKTSSSTVFWITVCS